MKHGVGLRKLGRDTAHRLSMLKTMVSQLITHERIETTLHKAKEVRRLADQMVTLGKRGTLTAKRQAMEVVREDGNLNKVFGEFAERYKYREGGYTRVLQTRRRQGDNAQMAFIEYVDREGELLPARLPRHHPSRKGLLPAAAQAAVETAPQ